MANNAKDAKGAAFVNGESPKGIPYPSTGNFKPENYNQEVKEAILASRMPKEGNANLAFILKNEYGYLIDGDGNLQGRSEDPNPNTGNKYLFLLKNNQRVSMPLPEKIIKDYPQLPKWMGFFQDLDDFCTKILKFWNWNRQRKSREKKGHFEAF